MSPAARNALLRAWRLGALVALGLSIGSAQRGGGGRGAMPIAVREVVRIVPEAAAVDLAPGPFGQAVRASSGTVIGTVLTTSPDGDAVVGYAGRSEVLLVLAPDGRMIGARLRGSEDTVEHVADVAGDARFWAWFSGRTARELAGRTAAELGVDGVSGATMTSVAAVDAVGARLGAVIGEVARGGATLRFGLHDLAVVGFALGGVVLAFHRGARRVLRRWFRVAAVVYLGIATAELLALSLGAGFARSGLPWLRAPGIAVLAASAWLVPWASGRSPYCAHVCPHGVIQEWIGGLVRGSRLRLPRVPGGARWFLAAIPAALLVVATGALVIGLPLDLAGIEAFDAWLLGAGAAASVVVAMIGLAASAFEPMAYCRYGCATGRLLGLGATHSRAGGRLDSRDLLLAVLLAVAVLGWLGREMVRGALAEVPL